MAQPDQVAQPDRADRPDQSDQPDQPDFVIVPIPISDYANHAEVAGIEGDVAGIVELLRELGGGDLAWNVPAQRRDEPAVRARLNAWAAHPQPRNSVVVWLGHGEEIEGRAWLATQETPSPIRYTGVGPEVIGDAIAREWNTRTRGTDEWAIVVIEACGSGVFAQLLLKTLTVHNAPNRLLIMPVGGDGATYAGRFRVALQRAVRSYTINDKIIHVDDLVRRVANHLDTHNEIAIGMSGLPPIRRRHLAATTATLPLDTYAVLKAVIDTLPPLGTPGGELRELARYFVGRHEDQASIVAWLGTQPHGMYVVTGPAGSGKSALLGYVLMRTSPALRAVFDARGGEALQPVEVPFDAVVHLTGLTTDGVVTRIARAFGIDQPPAAASGQNVDWLVERLAGRTQRCTILTDALDEAQEAYAIAASVLRQLAALPNVRVVVGTRGSPHDDPDRPVETKDLLHALGDGDTTTVRTLERDQTAIALYVRLRLTAAAAELGGPSEYTIARAADAITGTGRPFLYARLVVNELLARPDLLAGAMERGTGLEELLWLDHRGLLEAAAERLAATSRFAGPLLEALGTARGRGLPQADRVWAIVALALGEPAAAGARETEAQIDREIDELLVAAAPYIMLDAQDGRSVFRLAHRTFRDYYLDRPAAGADGDPARHRHRLVAHALIEAARRDPAVAASTYVVRHLVEHVARANAWATLAAAPEVLDRLDPNAVAAEVLRRSFGATGLPEQITAVAAARHTLAPVPYQDRAAIRMLATARYAGPDRPVPGPMSGRWRWAWAELRQDPLSVVIVGHRGVVTAAAAVPVPGGRMLLATGGSDGRVRLWDPTSGQPTAPPFHAHNGAVQALAAIALPDHTVLAGCGTDGLVRLWDPVTGTPIAQLEGSGPAYTALGTVTMPDGPRFVTGDSTGRLRLWTPDGSLTDGNLLSDAGSEVTAICAVEAGRPTVAVGDRAGYVRLWTPGSSGPPTVLDRRLVGRVNALCCAPGPGGVVLAAAGNERTVVRWYATADGWRAAPATGHRDWVNAAAPVSLGDGRNLVATAGGDGLIRLWDCDHPARPPAVLTGHTRTIRALAALPLPDGRVVLASGGDDRIVRLWAPALDPRAGGVHDRFAGPVTALAPLVTAARSARFAAGTADGIVQLRTSPADGGGRRADPVGFAVTSLAAVAGRNDAPVIAIGGDRSDIRVWAPQAARAASGFLRGHASRVTALAAVATPRGPLFVSGGEDTTVRLWDAATRQQLDAMDRHRSPVRAVTAALGHDGALVVASAGQADHVRLWFPAGDGRAGARTAGGPAVPGARGPLTLVVTSDRTLLALCDGAAAVRLWDVTALGWAGRPLSGHEGAVLASAVVHAADGTALLVTAGSDGTVRLWDPLAGAQLDVLRLDEPATALAALGPRLVIGYPLGLVAVDLLVEDHP